MEPYTTLEQAQKDIFSGKTTCVELVSFYLERIKAHESLNAFLETFDESAMAKAKDVDENIANGNFKRLSGLIVGIKDNMCYKGHNVSASSKILEDFESLFTATAVERMLEDDAIVIGRLNCDEFAMGSSNENSAYGVVKNPLDETKVPGGSSGGSSAALAAGLCMATLGSDTGGSIRQPASFCGLVGFKPTYGRVSRHGLIAYASSFDQIGTFTNTVEDAARIMEVIAGKDDYDSTLSTKPVPQYTSNLNEGAPKLKIAYFKSYLDHEGLDQEIRDALYNLIDQLREAGHEVEEKPFAFLDHLVPTYYVLTTAECSSNLARYDGINVGKRSTQASDITTTYVKSRSEGFGDEVKRRIMLGTYVLSAGYYDAYYSQAQKVRRKLKEEVDEIFQEFDLILTPTSPHTAFPIDNQADDPIKMYLEDIFTSHFNLTGHPAVSLPMGTHSNGLPFGIQLAGKSFGEKELLQFSNHIMNSYPLKRKEDQA